MENEALRQFSGQAISHAHGDIFLREMVKSETPRAGSPTPNCQIPYGCTQPV